MPRRKPANLMLDANGTVKVPDLGLALLPLQDADFRNSNGPIGTPPWQVLAKVAVTTYLLQNNLRFEQ